MPASLTEQQFQMLRAVVAAGWCVSVTPARHRSAWTVRLHGARGSVVLTFAQPTGDALLRRGFIRPDPAKPERHGKSGVVVRRYVPTGTGRRVVEKSQARKA